MAKRGKKPNATQMRLLQSYGHNPKDWLYVSESVVGDSQFKSLSKNDPKIIRQVFRHRTTGQEIFLEVE